MSKRNDNYILYTFIFFAFMTTLVNINAINIQSIFLSIIEFIFTFTVLFIRLFNKKITNIKNLVMIGLIILCGVTSLIHLNGFEYYFSFMTLLISIYLILGSKFNLKKHKYLLIVLLSIYLVINFVYTFRYNSNGTNVLNPNATGRICFIFSVFFCANYYLKSNKMSLLLSLLFFGFQFLFKSRNTTLANIILYLLIFIFKFFSVKISSKKKKWIIAILLILQVPLCFFYSTVLYDLIGKNNLIIFGKDIFTGRQIIWMDFFTQIKGHYLFGIGNTFKSSWIIEGENMTNLHNSSLAIISNFGIISYALFVILLSYLISEKKNTNVIFIYCILLIFISMFETIFISYFALNTILIGFILIFQIRGGFKNGK